MSVRTLKTIITIFWTFLATIMCVADTPSNRTLERHKRTILQYPYNSCTGVLVAISIPLTDLPNRNVFMSYNFEANYNMPTSPESIIPGPLERLDMVNSRDAKGDPEIEVSNKNDTEVDEAKKEKREILQENKLFTRAKVYKMLIKKLRKSGINGKSCLLRAICDAAVDPIHHHNGVLGDVFHIILTPSSSATEAIHPEYYTAELAGKQGDCSKYDVKCPHNVLDYISEFI